jgi:hypothetical protein
MPPARDRRYRNNFLDPRRNVLLQGPSMRRCPPIALAAVFLLALTVRAEPVRIVSRIKRVPVQSTAIASVGYSKRLHALEIEFRNGAIYRYLEIDRDVYDGLINAGSKARFYDDNIRHKYRSLHVRPRNE